jgi:hypothetical protein
MIESENFFDIIALSIPSNILFLLDAREQVRFPSRNVLFAIAIAARRGSHRITPSELVLVYRWSLITSNSVRRARIADRQTACDCTVVALHI